MSGERVLFDKLIAYADHRNECGATVSRNDKYCSCGFAELLLKLSERGEGK